MFDITILTEDRYLDPLKKNWYSDQVLLEDEILFESLKKRGFIIYETNLMRRLSGLLYLDNKVVGDIKEKVKQNLK